MAAPSVNTRKLKDSVAEYLKKNKLDKACETLEQLVKAEPKDMTHRLKLGDTYRRLGDAAKAIGSYQSAAKFFSDEGLLIKAIAAIKIILEIDPQNQMAQRELGEMNQRRFAKPTLESAGLRPPPSSPPIGREAAEPEPQPAGSARPKDGRGLPQASERGLDLQLGDDDEPLELDDGRSFTPSTDKIKPRSGAASAPSLPRPPGPAPKQRGAFDLGAGADPIDLESLPEAELAEAELEELPSEAIVEERKRDQAAAKPAKPAKPALAAAAPLAARSPARPPPPPSQLDDEDEPLEMGRRAPAARAPASAPPLPPARPASAGRAVPSSGPARPIADLLISDTDEIELLSVSSDRDLPAVSDLPPEPARPATVAPLARKIAADDMDADVDQAFGALSPAASGQPSRPAPPRVALFDDLPQEAFVDLVNRLSYLRFSPPELIIREGDPGRSFFVIVEGKVRVFKAQKGGDEITLAHLSEGAFFGEMALLSGAPRTANVAAEEDTELLEVTDAVLREVVQKYPTVAVSLKKFYRQRLLNNVMAISPLFKDFVPAERKAIVDRFRMRQFAQGEVLITEGTPSDGLYVVLHGAVNVETRAPNNQRVALARLKEGEVFGEMSLLTRKNATATVTALTNSIVLKLPREHFQELVLTHPQILELVSVLTEQRKNATDAILQGQGPGVDGMAFV